MNRSLHNFTAFVGEIFRSDKKYFMYYVLGIILKSASPFTLVVFPKYILNEIMGQRRINYIIIYLVAMGVINVIINILISACDPKLSNRTQHLRTKLSEKLSQHILQMDYEYMENAQVIDQKQKAVEFVYSNVGIDNFSFNSQNLIIAIVQVLGYIYLLSTISPIIIIAILLVSIINAYFQGRAEKYSYEAEMEVLRPNRRGSYIDYICSDFGHIKDIKMFNIQNWILKNRKELNNIKLKAFDKTANKFVLLGVIISLSNNILNISVYVYLILRLTWNTLLIGDFTMYLSVINNFSSSIGGIFTTVVKFQQINRYLTNYLDFKNIKSKDQLYANEVAPEIDNYTIKFKNVSFKYPGHDTYALKNITTTINHNERISIVGKNGAGKTTFVKLLVRLYEPTDGDIFIDDVNIKDINYTDYRNMISAVFQDYKLFAFSIKENIAFDNSDCFNDDKCINLLKEVGLQNKINNLPNGVHTGLGKQFDEEGTELSGGESQKIAIARAIFKKSPIVVLDEPTSALDPLSEYEIYKCFDNLIKNTTSIYISHRLSSTKFSDKIIVFDNGEIIEEGSHNQLMNENGLYKEMFDKQSQFYIHDDKDVRDEKN